MRKKSKKYPTIYATSQRVIANRLKVHPSRVSQIINGTAPDLSWDLAKRMAEVGGYNPAYVMDASVGRLRQIIKKIAVIVERESSETYRRRSEAAKAREAAKKAAAAKET